MWYYVIVWFQSIPPQSFGPFYAEPNTGSHIVGSLIDNPFITMHHIYVAADGGDWLHITAE